MFVYMLSSKLQVVQCESEYSVEQIFVENLVKGTSDREEKGTDYKLLFVLYF